MRTFAADRLLPLRVVNDVHVLRPLVRSRLRHFQAVDLMRFVFFWNSGGCIFQTIVLLVSNTIVFNRITTF